MKNIIMALMFLTSVNAFADIKLTRVECQSTETQFAELESVLEDICYKEGPLTAAAYLLEKAEDGVIFAKDAVVEVAKKAGKYLAIPVVAVKNGVKKIINIKVKEVPCPAAGVTDASYPDDANAGQTCYKFL